MGSLDGRRTLLTGAAAGLGREIALRYAEEGALSVALCDIDADGLDKVRAEVEQRGAAASTHVVDVSDGENVTEAFAAAFDTAGGIDVVVNNAGILSQSARIHNTTTADFRRVLDVNVLGAFHGIRAAADFMRKSTGGTIINTASVSGLTAWSHAAPYCASKAAVIQLTKVAAIEYAADGITVNCVCPGTFRSAIHDEMPAEALDAIASRHPVGRLGDAGEVVGAYVYLADARSSFTTGAALVVDGGYSAP